MQQIGAFLHSNEFRAVREKPPRQLGLCRQTLVDRAASGAGQDFASRLSSPAAFLGWAMHALLVCLCCLRFSLRHFGYLFAGARAKCLQLFQWQVIRDETHRAIGKGEGGTARMITAEGGKAKHFPAANRRHWGEAVHGN